MSAEVTVRGTIRDQDPDAVFARLRDFSSYPEYTDVVRKIEILEEPSIPEQGAAADAVQTSASKWEVFFRKGILKWKEREQISAAERRINFDLIKGDVSQFEGFWQVHQPGGPDEGAVEVEFHCTFDVGIPLLAPVIEPMAIKTLRETIQAILRGVVGQDIAFSSEKEKQAA